MLSSKALRDIVAEARPIIERQLDDAARIAAFREVVTAQGGDWSSLKALIKAQVQDEADDGKRVQKILEKADFATSYADQLGWAKMNDYNNSADADDGDIEEEANEAEVNHQTGRGTREAGEHGANRRNGGAVERRISEGSPQGEAEDAGVTGGESAAPISNPASDALRGAAGQTGEVVAPPSASPVAQSRQVNPHCRKHAAGQPCALSHSMASCSICASAAARARVAA